MRTAPLLLIVTALAVAQPQRPMTFLDALTMNSVQGGTLSSDGKYFAYALSTADWKKGKRFTDVWLSETGTGPSSARQMTFTTDKNEEGILWLPDSRRILFLSNRDAAEGKTTNQLYLLRIDGGEAERLTDAKDGIASPAVSADGRWVGYLAGKEEERQVYVIPADSLGRAKPRMLKKHATPVSWWRFAPDSRSILFTSPDSVFTSDKKRKEKKFDVRIRNEASAPVHLWNLGIATRTEQRLTSGAAYSVSAVTVSPDARWVGFRGTENDRYKRTVEESSSYSDLYLLDCRTGSIERLTRNADIAESQLSFSPDGKMCAYSADEDQVYFRNSRIYIRSVADSGGSFRKVGTNLDLDAGIDFWSEDASTIYFTTGWRSTTQLFALSLKTGMVAPVTDIPGTVAVSYDENTRRIFALLSTPTEPSDAYVIGRMDQFAKRSSWKRLTDANPQVRQMGLGVTKVVTWTSTDGSPVEGILVLPPNMTPGTRVPLIVQIHGGPASAVTQSFIAGYGNYSHVYAGAGYACLLPNYRGSTNYGEKFKRAIMGAYFPLGYDDIMTGVDALIAQGIVDSTRMGVMGWSAGGHWSNWILTHTKRFKAISSGAGAMNWTSMYAQTDIQRGRENYFGENPTTTSNTTGRFRRSNT